MAVTDGVGERVGPVVVRGRRIGDALVGIHRRRAVRRRPDTAHHQRVTVRIGVVPEHGDRDRRVFRRRRRIVIRHGRVVDRGDRDRHRAHVRVEAPVVRFEREAVRPVVVRRRRVGHRRRRAAQRSMRRAGDDGVGQRRAFDVGRAQRDRLGRVFIGRDHLVAGHRRVVHGSDTDRDRRDVRLEAPVVGLEGEAVGPVVVRGRRIGQRRRRPIQRAVRRTRDDRIRERRTLRVGCPQCDRLRRILICRDRLIAGHGHIVHRRDRHTDCTDGCAAMAVADCVGKRVNAVVVRRRCVGDRPVRMGRGAAVQRRAHSGHGQAVAIHVRIVREYCDRHRRIFDRRRCIVDSGRCVVHRGDGDRHGRDVRVEAAVVRLEREAVGAVVVRSRRVDEIRRGAAQRAVRGRGHKCVREG